MNQLILSDDRMELVIKDGSGRQATLRSARPGGFTQADMDNARDYQFSGTLQRGQVNSAWKFFAAGVSISVSICTGPPTWWMPRARVRRGLMLGWLRALVAIKVTREHRPT